MNERVVGATAWLAPPSRHQARLSRCDCSTHSLFTEDVLRRLGSSAEVYEAGIRVIDEYEYMESLTHKNGTMSGSNKTPNSKPAKGWGKLGLVFEADDGDIILRSASVKPNTWRPKLVANTSDFEDNGLVFFEVPEDGLTELKKYTGSFKFRLGDGWKSGDLVFFKAFTTGTTNFVRVIVR